MKQDPEQAAGQLGSYAEELPFGALFNAMPTPLLVVAPPHWTVVAANDARLQVTDTTRDGQIGSRLFDLFPDDPNDPQADGVRKLTASFERVLSTRATDQMAVQRYAIREADGRFVERWWTPVNTPILGADGEVAFIIHRVEDVTEAVRLRGEAAARDQLARDQQAVIDRLRASEAALRASEERLRASEEFSARILASSADCIKVLDGDARLEFMSEGGMCVMEVEDFGAVKGASWPDFWPGEGHQDALAAVEQAKRGGVGRFEGFATTLKGAPRWWDVIVTPILGTDGTPEKLLSVSRDVTLTKQAQAALRESQRELQVLADTLPVLVSYVDRDERYRFLNRTYEAWWPDRWPTMQGSSIREVVGDAAYAEAKPWIDRALAGESVRFDQLMPYQTGPARHVRVEYVPRASDGKVHGFYTLVQDITDQKRAEGALREREEQLRLATEAAEIGLWDLDVTTGALFWPPRVKAMFGISADVAISMADYYAGLHPDDLDQTSAAFAAALDPEKRALYDVEYRTIGKEDGIVRWVAAAGRGQFDADGRCVRVIGTAIDITRRKRIEDQLRELNATLEEQVAEHTADRDRMWRLSTDIMLVAKMDGTISAVNPGWKRLLGWADAELIGSNFMDLVHPEDQAATIREMEKLGQGATTFRFENRYRASDGDYRWISWIAVPDQDLVHAVGRDVTTERAAADELASAQEALRQSQKMEAVGQLTGGLAHDFNNLLTGIMGNLELLQHRIARGRFDDVDRLVNAAQGAGRRAASLTQRLLAFSRRQTLDPKPTDINRLIAGMEELLRRTVGPTADIEIVGAAGLWTAMIDPSQLENALLNLCINARDAMPDGGRITVETANKWLDDRTARERDLPPGQYLSLCVTDTGTGMTPQTIERAFEPFFTTKPIGQGTGLGLSMIYGFARQSGGQVRIYSEVGQGTTVCVYLPRSFGDVDPEDEAAALSIRETARGETILLVDDEATIRHLVDEVLDEIGYTVIGAADGAAGLKVLQSGVRIDLLITDVGLPNGMNGRQVADAARSLRPDLKVLFITGYAENAAVGNGHLDPGMALLTKPFGLDDLTHKVRNMLGKVEDEPSG
ncbi:MAG: PAS domain-containing protein [Janthinobacterium lividum]